MAKSSRTNPHVVDWLQQLQQEPHRFGFNAALRKLEAIHSEKPRLGESVRAGDDLVRLGQEPSLTFAPTSLARFLAGSGDAPDRLDNYFFGLFGPNGPMPLHITEYARSRERNEADRTFRRFADVFHHRMLCLFYRAWANGEPVVNMDRPEADRFSLFAGALFGMGGPSFRNRDHMPDPAKLFRAGRLSLQTRPAEGLRAILEDFFLLPFAIHQFIGKWLAIARQDRLKLGCSGVASTLGAGTLLGASVWTCQHKFRIVAGPLSLQQFRQLLPDAKSLASLVAIVRNYVGDTLDWDLRLILKRNEVPGIVLGSAGELGWTSWLGVRHDECDANDVVITPHLEDAAGHG